MANFQNKHPLFIQFGTGIYSYKTAGQLGYSHCIYALDEEGGMWKFVPKEQDWYRFEELNISFEEDTPFNFLKTKINERERY